MKIRKIMAYAIQNYRVYSKQLIHHWKNNLAVLFIYPIIVSITTFGISNYSNKNTRILYEANIEFNNIPLDSIPIYLYSLNNKTNAIDSTYIIDGKFSFDHLTQKKSYRFKVLFRNTPVITNPVVIQDISDGEIQIGEDIDITSAYYRERQRSNHLAKYYPSKINIARERYRHDFRILDIVKHNNRLYLLYTRICDVKDSIIDPETTPLYKQELMLLSYTSTKQNYCLLSRGIHISQGTIGIKNDSTLIVFVNYKANEQANTFKMNGLKYYIQQEVNDNLIFNNVNKVFNNLNMGWEPMIKNGSDTIYHVDYNINSSQYYLCKNDKHFRVLTKNDIYHKERTLFLKMRSDWNDTTSPHMTAYIIDKMISDL